MLIILLIILGFLMSFISKRMTFKIILSIILNIIVMVIYFILFEKGINPIILTYLISFIFLYILLFIMNDKNSKTISSFYAVTIVISIIFIISYIVSNLFILGGFAPEYSEDINMFSFNIGFNLAITTPSILVISILGATVDTSISVLSTMNEIKENNPSISQKELFKSGINMGKDILPTTVNTLLFANFAVLTSVLLYFLHSQYDILTIINNKILVLEVIETSISIFASLLVIPIVSYIYSKRVTKKDF